MKIGVAFEEVHAAETELAELLVRAGERHKADHDVYYLTSSLAEKSARRIEQIAPHAARYDVSFDSESVDPERGGVLDKAREKASELSGRRPERPDCCCCATCARSTSRPSGRPLTGSHSVRVRRSCATRNCWSS